MWMKDIRDSFGVGRMIEARAPGVRNRRTKEFVDIFSNSEEKSGREGDRSHQISENSSKTLASTCVERTEKNRV